MKTIFTKWNLPFLGLFLLNFTLQAQINVTTITEEFNGSGGVKLGADGFLYIGNFGAELQNPNGSEIWKISLDGTITEFASGFQGASGNAFDSEGNFYQSNIAGNYISKITADGATITTYATTGISAPVGLVFDSNDNLFVCNCGNNTIQKITTDGNSTTFASGTIFDCPNGITVDENDNLYVANFGGSNQNGDAVLKITPDGTVTTLASIAGFNNGHLVYFQPDSILFVNSHGSSRVYQVDLEGNVSTIAGSGARGNTDGPAAEATFSRPNGIAISTTGDTLFLNSSIPTVDNPAGGFYPLNPSVIRMITGVKGLTPTQSKWTFEGLDLYNSPNPVDSQTTIHYELPLAATIQISLFDQQGKYLQTIDQGHKLAGKYSIELTTNHLPSGVYEYVISSKEFMLTRRLIKE